MQTCTLSRTQGHPQFPVQVPSLTQLMAGWLGTTGHSGLTRPGGQRQEWSRQPFLSQAPGTLGHPLMTLPGTRHIGTASVGTTEPCSVIAPSREPGRKAAQTKSILKSDLCQHTHTEPERMQVHF